MLLELIKPSKIITDDGAMNPFQVWVGKMGATKTNLGKKEIKQQIDAGLGGGLIDGKAGEGSLEEFTVRYLAEQGWPPEKVFINDHFHPYGHPMQDYLYDDKQDHVSWFQIVEELTSATVQMSLVRSTPGPVQASISRMSFASLMLADRPLGDITRFLTDQGFRANVVKKAGLSELENFWLGEHAYYKLLQKDALESTRNKWDNLTLNPAIKPCISQRDIIGEFANLKDFMANGGWWIHPLSENKYKTELRLTLAQLAQYQLKVGVLQREEATEKPFWAIWMDEYPQYRSQITHNDTLRLARSQNVGLIFLCQDTGIFSDAELRALAGAATWGTFACERSSAEDVVRQIFKPRGLLSKDWDGKTNYSVRDEIDNLIALAMEQRRGEALVRVDPNPDAYFLEVEQVPDPDPRSERSFREAVAKRWYRPWKKSD
jgi:hypothetical protein